VPEPSEALSTDLAGLGAGEQQAILLAAERGLRFWLRPRGTKVGRCGGSACCRNRRSIRRGEAAGHHSAAIPLLSQIREAGYWLSDVVLDAAAESGW
jgi:hypothetical protein